MDASVYIHNKRSRVHCQMHGSEEEGEVDLTFWTKVNERTDRYGTCTMAVAFCMPSSSLACSSGKLTAPVAFYASTFQNTTATTMRS